jgi:hypothetical protein
MENKKQNLSRNCRCDGRAMGKSIGLPPLRYGSQWQFIYLIGIIERILSHLSLFAVNKNAMSNIV